MFPWGLSHTSFGGTWELFDMSFAVRLSEGLKHQLQQSS